MATSRALTAGEIALAQTIFGTTVDYSTVQVHEGTAIGNAGGRPKAPNGEIHYPSGHPAYAADFSTGTIEQKATFIHEMAHVMQDQAGMNVVLERMNDGGDYTYDEIFAGVPFHEIPMEGQAEFLKDYFLEKQGYNVTPYDLPAFENQLPKELPNGNPTGDSLDDLETPPVSAPMGPDGLPKSAPWNEGGVQPIFDFSFIPFSPLVLDLDGDGIELAQLNKIGSVYWDIDSDGFAEASGWISGGDGLLAIDLNSDGYISEHTELFGNANGHTNGFLALADYDTNSDDALTSADSQFSDMLVWIDANSNGFSEASELHTLNALGITSIDLSYSNVNYEVAGNDILQESTFTINGNTRTIVDAWFSYDDVNTRYVDSITFDDRVYGLPNLRGYGEVADLSIAMSLNTSLLLNVENIANSTLDDVLDPSFGLEQKINEIIYQWAAVDGINPTDTTYVDARTLAFLEKITAQEYTTQPDPTQGSSELMEHAFYEAYNSALSKIVIQAGLADNLFVTPPIYIPYKDDFEGSLALDFNSIEAFVSGLSLSGADLKEAWEQILRIIEGSVGIDKLSTSDLTSLDQAIYNTDATLSIESIMMPNFHIIGLNNVGDPLSGDDTLLGSVGEDILYGEGGNDVIYGDFSEDQLYGGAGNDELHGGFADDVLYGGDGNDVLNGGRGWDYIYGGAGDDTYLFGKGDGWNNITEYAGEGNDKLLFADEISVSDVQTWTYSQSKLAVVVDGGGSLTFNGSFISGQGLDVGTLVETIEFGDSTIWDFTNGLILNDSDDARTIDGSTLGDTINGNGGSDTLNGWNGNDILNGGSGTDYLYGHNGDDILITSVAGEYDRLYGGAGADKFVAANDAGVATFLWAWDFSKSEGDSLDISDYLLGYNMVSDSLTDFLDITQSGGHTQVRIDPDGTGTSIGWGTYSQLQYFTSMSTDEASLVADGTLIVSKGTDFDGDATANTLFGNNLSNTIKGFGGDDTLYGADGDDMLFGGDGSDTLHGGTGADTFTIQSGDTGTDTIQDFSTADGDVLDLSDVISFDPLTDTITDFVQVTDNGTNSTVAIDADGTANGASFTTVATLLNVTGLTDEAALVTNGNLIAA